MTQPTPAFKAKDGKLFENEVDSKLHDINTEFKTWYEEKEGENGKFPNSLCYFSYSKLQALDTDMVIDWILSHRDNISSLIKEHNEINNK